MQKEHKKGPFFLLCDVLCVLKGALCGILYAILTALNYQCGLQTKNNTFNIIRL